jgi:hypothetical protein
MRGGRGGSKAMNSDLAFALVKIILVIYVALFAWDEIQKRKNV